LRQKNRSWATASNPDTASPKISKGRRPPGGEHEQLGPALLEEPGRVLEGERREPHLPPQVLGGQQGQPAEDRLELVEGAVGVVDVAQHGGHPTGPELNGRPAQIGVVFEDAVNGQAGQETLR